MTDRRADSEESAGRSATVRTELDDAEILAASVRPDNTSEIDTRVETDDSGVDGDAEDAGTVVTTVERETTGGLRTTVDDYVVNLAVAQRVVQAGKRFTADEDTTTQS
ncbi:KEOPS complex Pcc1-like subunit [Halorussus limi]|uniref:KEOPS complex Pcc1-like subunit n=1 Tax=Halorussus limi TaxID=2938695 RepID=A0A8U0HSF9_9EURY|nr:KEOPS complex subunit Pcc1 [Halorussus limi]UPV73604.1 KEOPS complex Pcc1-like subunit [Halorussus limi]